MNQNQLEYRGTDTLPREVREALSYSLSYQEYAARRQEFPTPYIETIAGPNAEVTLFGAEHVNDSSHPQMQQIVDLIDQQRPELLLVEGMRALKNIDRKNRLQDYMKSLDFAEAAKLGEPFLATWRATQLNIKVDSPEPNEIELNTALLGRGYDPRAIIVEQCLTMTVQWDRENTATDFESYLRPTWKKLADQFKLDPDADIKSSLSNLAQELGLPELFTESQDDLIWDLQDPTVSNEKPDYVTKTVSRARSQIRDRQIIIELNAALKTGTSKVMIVFGASHIHMLAGAIKQLVEAHSTSEQ